MLNLIELTPGNCDCSAETRIDLVLIKPLRVEAGRLEFLRAQECVIAGSGRSRAETEGLVAATALLLLSALLLLLSLLLLLLTGLLLLPLLLLLLLLLLLALSAATTNLLNQ